MKISTCGPGRDYLSRRVQFSLKALLDVALHCLMSLSVRLMKRWRSKGVFSGHWIPIKGTTRRK